MEKGEKMIDAINHRSESQSQLLKAHLESGKEITAKDALLKLGIGRLAARIHELRVDHNLPIKTRVERKGKRSWAVYSLKRGD